MFADKARDLTYRVIAQGSMDRHDHMQARLARRLDERGERHLIEQPLKVEGNRPAFLERRSVVFRLLSRHFAAGINVRVKIEQQIVRKVDRRCGEAFG